ncbi:kelch repeat-containing protein [Myxococcaceae bacterium GXIMD 01537]
MNKTPTVLLRVLALTLLTACTADSLSSSDTGSEPRASASGALGTPGACWSLTGSFSTQRVTHTATLLPNGKVLVAGGYQTVQQGGLVNFIYLASAELYDPATGTWGATGSMTEPRRDHTATLLPGGKVLVAGGYEYTDGDLATAELYDPATGTWSATGSMTEPRRDHTATLLPDGKVLAVGGVNDNNEILATAELYDPATGTWSLTGSLVLARAQQTATLLPNGKVLIVGGTTPNDTIALAEVYDPATGTFSAAGSMSVPRRRHTTTLLANGKVLVAGGRAAGSSGIGSYSSAEVYDPATSTWSATGAMSVIRVFHTATLLANGKVLVTGGTSGGGLTSAEVYDPATGTWSTAGSMSVARSAHVAVRLANGQVLVMGGVNGLYNNIPLETELYACGAAGAATCPDGSAWSEVPFSSGDVTLKLHCPQVMTLECSTNTWADPGATATDGAGPVQVHKYNTGDDDGDGIPGSQDPDDFGPGPNLSVPNSYTMEYIAWSATAQVNVIRTVHVQDTTPPVLNLKGPAQSTHTCGSAWVDPGVEATDACDGDKTYSVVTTGYVNGWAEGTYTLTYALTDGAANSAPSLSRTVQVVNCPW